VCAARYVEGTGTTSVVLSIPNEIEPQRLVVIDHVLATTINGTAGQPLLVNVNGVTIARKTITNAVADFLDKDFGAGWPLWAVSGSSSSSGAALQYSGPDSVWDYLIQGGSAASGELDQAAGFSFTAVETYGIRGIYMVMRKIGAPSDNLTLDLRTTSITGTVIATSSATAVSSLTAGYSELFFAFATPTSLAASTKYYSQIIRSGARNTSNYTLCKNSINNGNSGGGSYRRGNNVWEAEGGGGGVDDLAFRTETSAILELTAPASSTGSTLLVTYHYARPSEVRD